MPHPPLTSTLAYLTADVPGTGGTIKCRPEDFHVEELPLYPPAGQGEHVYLGIEKRERTTTDVVRRLAKLFNVRRSDIGYAGLKDKQAVTRQTFSVYLPKTGTETDLLPRLEFTGLKLLWSARHANKLRRGHLAGNRFVLFIRQVAPPTVVRAKRVLDTLVAQGVPNFIGEQRFGHRQNNHLLGKLLLLEQWQEFLDTLLGRPDAYDSPPVAQARRFYEQHDYAQALELWPRWMHHDRQALDLLRQGKSARAAVLGIDAGQREFLLNAMQSAVFNQVLDQRLRAGTFDRLQAGDLAMKHENGSLFAVDAAIAEAENTSTGRAALKQVSPTGPMWGQHMMQPADAVLATEIAALNALGINVAQLGQAQSSGQVEGNRRSLRALVVNPDISAGTDDAGPFLRLAFDLPPGSYATTILREIIKPEQTGSKLEEEDA